MENSYTKKMEEELYQQWGKLDDLGEDYQSLIDTINRDNFFRSFGDGLLFFLQQKKPELSLENAIKYIEEQCSKTGVSKSDIASANTLRNWFKGGPRPRKGEDSRRSMFALSFALQLSPTDTAELFHRVYLDRAFDYRSEEEIVYYFCLQNQKTWDDANRLINMLSETTHSTDDHTISRTVYIKSDLQSLCNEEQLISYIASHGHNLKQKNIAAKHFVAKLIETSKVTIEEETNLKAARITAEANREKKEDVMACDRYLNSNADSLNHLYGVIVSHLIQGGNGTHSIFKNARLPDEIRRRFPEAATLSKKNPTYEELRKLIILLVSYNYWFKAQQKSCANIEDYVDELNVYLNESSLSPMYYGNPYDWLFMYCTLTDYPLDTFREILAIVLE